MDITEVPDFNKMYELYDPCTVMFFFRYALLKLSLTWGTVVGGLIGQRLWVRRKSVGRAVYLRQSMWIFEMIPK